MVEIDGARRIDEVSTDPAVVVEVVGSTGVVRLNRQSRGNAVTPEVVREMGDAVEALCDDDAVRAVVLTGTGRVFCAGADVQEMHEVYEADGADGLMAYLGDTWMPAVQDTVRRLWAAPRPLVAAFNGAATAGGLDFGLTCDVRLAAEGARFAESYVNLGMVPVAGGAFLLPRLVGSSWGARMLADGQLLAAPEAQRLGLVDEVCPAEDLRARALEVAEQMSRGPVETFAHVKAISRAAETPHLHAALEQSLQANIDLIARGDVRERIVAVMERYST